MPRFVALLRGVNVGGKNKVAMSELRALAESIGLEDASTLIQSGNLVFTASSRPSPQKLATAIGQRFGISVSVAVRSASELRRVLSNQPFGAVATSSIHIGFLTDKPPPSALKQLDSGRFAPEDFVVRGLEVYLHLPTGMARTKVPAYLDSILRVPMTVRNWNTVTKLADMAGRG